MIQTDGFCIYLNKNEHYSGGFSLNVGEAKNATNSQKQLIQKIRLLAEQHKYTTTVSECLDNMVNTSTMTHQIFSSIVKILPQETHFIKNGNKIGFSVNKKTIQLSFRLKKKMNGDYIFSQILQVDGQRIVPDLETFQDYGVLTDKDMLYCWSEERDLKTFIRTKDYHEKIINARDIIYFFSQVIQPLLRHYTVHIDAEAIQRYVAKKKPKPLISILQDKERVLFELQFLYDKVEVVPPVLHRYYVFSEDGQLTQVDRNKEEEVHWLHEIFSMHSDFKILDEFKWEMSNKFFTPSWSEFFFSHLEQNGVQIKKNEAVEIDVKTYTPNVLIGLEQGDNYFDAIINIKINQYDIPLKQVQKLILENTREIFVNDQCFPISDAWIKKYRNIFMWGKLVQNKLRFLHYQDHLFDAFCSRGELFKRSSPIKKIEKDVSLPKGLHGELRDYQKEGFQWINILSQTNRGGILADDMGLGKTIQTLTQLLKFHETHKKLNALIVCPASLINNWKDEITKFAPSLSHMIYHMHNRDLKTEDLEKHQVIITSYNILQKDIKSLKNILFDYIILDESQYIKNPYSKTARCVFALNSKHRLCLSGTPLQNHTFDIYSQIHFLNPNILGSIENFKNKFSILIDQMEEKEPRDELKQLLDPFILRRTKKQVAQDLPEKSESIVYCKMEEEQREIYDYYRERYKNYLLTKIKKDGIQRSKLHVLQGLTFLRQICDSPNLMKEPVEFNKVPIKIKILKERLIPQEGENKALIFSQFIGMLGIVQDYIKTDNWNYAYFDGKTSIEQRSKEINRFQQDPNCKLFLISIKAGNVGLNLTAADYVYLIDPWWNPAIEQQAIDRTHRIGQKKNIFSFKFICEDTIEEKILALQKKKSNLADNLVMLNQNSLVQNLNPEDIEYLFSN